MLSVVLIEHVNYWHDWRTFCLLVDMCEACEISHGPIVMRSLKNFQEAWSPF